MFPGCVFVEIKFECEEFYDLFNPVINFSTSIIRVLGKESAETMTVTSSEQRGLKQILGYKREVKISEYIMEDDNMRITHRVLKDLES